MNTNFKLPKRWCIKRSIENYRELNPLLKQINGKTYTGTGSNLYHSCDYFHNIPVKGQMYMQGYKHRVYTEITLEQLKNSLTHINIMENFAIKGDQTNPLSKKIIGYKLIKPEYRIAAGKIGDFSNFEHLERYLNSEHARTAWDNIVEKLKEAGVLGLWFEPVYEDTEPRLPQIAGYNGKIGNTDVIYGCQKVPISLFDTEKCDLQTIKISGITVSSKDIEQIRKVLVYGSFI